MTSRSRLAGASALLVLAGCATYVPLPMHTIPSPGVTSIPATITLESLRSAMTPPPLIRRIDDSGPSPRPDPLQRFPSGENAETELVVTAESQILTGELALRLADDGFDLREEPPADVVVKGEVFFRHVGRLYGGFMVVACQVRVVDTLSGKILCQVALDYAPDGISVATVADAIARQLAEMAGLMPSGN